MVNKNIDDPKNKSTKKQVVIDFLYLDLNICERCKGTDLTLDEALIDVANVLEATGVEVLVNKINVNKEEFAITHKFVSSPTIRINGEDIQMEIKENNCESCGDLCGDKVDCRIWVYLGNEYSTPPKAMIIEAILKTIYGNIKKAQVEQEYIIPENLRHFYKTMKNKSRRNSKKLSLIRNL